MISSFSPSISSSLKGKTTTTTTTNFWLSFTMLHETERSIVCLFTFIPNNIFILLRDGTFFGFTPAMVWFSIPLLWWWKKTIKNLLFFLLFSLKYFSTVNRIKAWIVDVFVGNVKWMVVTYCCCCCCFIHSATRFGQPKFWKCVRNSLFRISCCFRFV